MPHRNSERTEGPWAIGKDPRWGTCVVAPKVVVKNAATGRTQPAFVAVAVRRYGDALTIVKAEEVRETAVHLRNFLLLLQQNPNLARDSTVIEAAISEVDRLLGLSPNIQAPERPQGPG